MNLRETHLLLRVHRRSRWRPWRCRCGWRHPCNARTLGEAHRADLNERGGDFAPPPPLADGVTVNVAGYHWYADLIARRAVPPPVGRAPVRSEFPWTRRFVSRVRLVRPYVDRDPR